MAKHLLFVAPSAYPLGGVATWLDYIVPGLRRCGWDVTVGLVEGKFHDPDAYLEVHPTEQVLRIPYKTGTKQGRVRALVQALRDTRPDIVITVNIADVAPAIDRIRNAQEWSPRLAMALHGIQPDLIDSINVNAEVLDAVICTNRLACEMVAIRSSIVQDRIYNAPYGVKCAEGMPRVYRRESDGVFRIAYVGRLEHTQKRIGDLVGIVSELDGRGVSYEIVIAGDGPDSEWLQSQLCSAVTSGKVRFLGKVAAADLVDDVYHRADVLLVTSFWETGPIIAWEAMASQVALVSSAYVGSGLERSLESGENCLLFGIGDTVSAAACLEKLQDTELRERLVRNGLTLVSSRYSTAASIKQWNATLEQIIIRPPLRASSEGPDAAQFPPAGRLDRLFGRQLGETLRELIGLKYDHGEPGGEWPHAGAGTPLNDDEFWQLARSLDNRGASAAKLRADETSSSELRRAPSSRQ